VAQEVECLLCKKKKKKEKKNESLFPGHDGARL
jgi:hypothetical protein